MKFIALVLAVLLLTGCNAAEVGNRISAAGDMLGEGMESMRDAIADSRNQEVSRSVTVPITREEAEAIALEHVGFTADQVTGLRTEYEVDDGVARYEVQFRQGRWEYDYEINAETGDILSYDRDD